MDITTYESLGLNISIADVDPRRIVNGHSNENSRRLQPPGDTQYNPCSRPIPVMMCPGER